MLMLMLLQSQGIRRVHNYNYDHKHNLYRLPYWRPAGSGVLTAGSVSSLTAGSVSSKASCLAASPVLGISPQTAMIYIVVLLDRMGWDEWLPLAPEKRKCLL